MSILTIEDRCVRKGSHVIAGIYGESGSGKTYSALLFGRGLVGPNGKLGLVDTETGRGRFYANDPDIGGYAYAELTPPFTPERCTEAIAEMAERGIDALVFDSSSHEWEGIGGILEAADATGKTGLLKWSDPKRRHKLFFQSILRSRMHLLLCLRAKEKLVQTGKGKDAEIVSAGLIAVQDKRFIYDVTVQMQMQTDQPGFYKLEKCPKDLLPAFTAPLHGLSTDRIGVGAGELVSQWVAGGEPVDHAHEALRQSGEDAAEGGMVSLRRWFEGLKRADKLKMKPLLEGNLKSIAEAADAEAAEGAEQAKPERTSPRSIRPAFLDGAIEQVRNADGPSHLAEIQEETLKELKAAKASPDVIDEFNAVCLAVFEKAA